MTVDAKLPVMKRIAVCLLVLLSLAACDGDRETTADDEGRNCEVPIDHPSPPQFEPARVLIDTGEGSVLLDAEVAEDEESRAFGLMHRESYPEDCGMVFMFFEPIQSGFWMEDTLIPLSIAFFDDQGEILEILDMEPCKADPCELYVPEVTYSGALEVNQGTFDRLGVSEGDVINVNR